MKTEPTFPPLLKGHRVPENKKPINRALAMVSKGKLGAGDVLWSEARNQLSLAIVMEPEVTRKRCGEMLYLLMVAFGDAAGAISAPEIAITYSWPSQILINEAIVGEADILVSENTTDDIPDWIIGSLNIAIRPDFAELDPGENIMRTTMWDEGCGDIDRTELIESVSRHIVNWIHTWGEDGFKPIHEQWMGRLDEKIKISSSLTKNDFVGLDENGNALIKNGNGTDTLLTLDAVNRLRESVG